MFDRKSLENHCDVFDRVWLEFKSSFLGIKSNRVNACLSVIPT
jgi:hypothetical protein